MLGNQDTCGKAWVHLFWEQAEEGLGQNTTAFLVYNCLFTSNRVFKISVSLTNNMC